MRALQRVIRDVERIKKKLARLSARESKQWQYLDAPLTSTDWDGDAHSTIAKTKIDLSAVFGVPANIRGVLCYVAIQDSGAGAGGGSYSIRLAPNDTAAHGMAVNCISTNDSYNRGCLTVSCDANGDIYYQIEASGADTADVIIQIWGYLY